MIVKDSVRLPIEKALINAPAHYPYIEMMNKFSSFKLDKLLLWKEIF